jgi:hypothetical protein
VCDVAEACLLEKFDGVETAVMHAALAGGSEAYPGPDYEGVRQHLHDLLHAPFAGVQDMSTEEAELRRAVGLL